MMPFAGYDDFDACVADNQTKSNPERYCGWLEERTTTEMQRRMAQRELAALPTEPDDPALEAVDETAPESDDETFHSLLVIEGIWTGDGRYMEDGSLTWRDLPLPLMALDRTTDGHDAAILVGQFTRIERLGRELHGWGNFVTSNDPEVLRLQSLIDTGKLRGISVDLDAVTYDVIVPAEAIQPTSEPDAEGNVRLAGNDESRMIVTAGRVMGATVCPFPAFAEAFIESHALVAAVGSSSLLTGFVESWSSVDSVDLTPPAGAREEADRGLAWRSELGRGGTAVGIARARDISNGRRLSPDTITRMLSYFARHEVDKQGQGWSPGEDGYPSNGRIAWALWGGDAGWAFARSAAESIAARRTDGSITAAVSPIVAPICPPASWFAQPKLDRPSPITITDDGRVYGHAATWGTCHIGFNGRCVTPPHSSTDYAWFRTGEVLLEDGSRVSVGGITVDTGHAAHHLAARPAAAHYDNTGSVVADVTAGEDAYGIWIAGSLRPGVTAEQLRAFMASDVSGDWRLVGGSMELVGLLSVNVPGFPKRRYAAHETQGLVASVTAAFSPGPVTSMRAATVIDRIAATIGRSKVQRVQELQDRVKGSN